MDTGVSPSSSLLILIGAALSVALSLRNRRNPSFALEVANRWIRLLVFSAAFGSLATGPFEVNRPFWVMAVIGGLVWVLLTTVYSWVIVRAFSQSGLPLFPTFRTCEPGRVRVPEPPRGARRVLDAEGFTKVADLEAEIVPGVRLFSSLWLDRAAEARVQFVFLPLSRGTMRPMVSIVSELRDGRKVVTDNVNLPFGGVAPPEWVRFRRPLTGAFRRLLSHHRRKVPPREVLPQETGLLESVESEQARVEQVNVERGLFTPRRARPELGNLTTEGRYRVWIEMLLLNYFGLTVRGK